MRRCSQIYEHVEKSVGTMSLFGIEKVATKVVDFWCVFTRKCEKANALSFLARDATRHAIEVPHPLRNNRGSLRSLCAARRIKLTASAENFGKCSGSLFDARQISVPRHSIDRRHPLIDHSRSYGKRTGRTVARALIHRIGKQKR